MASHVPARNASRAAAGSATSWRTAPHASRHRLEVDRQLDRRDRASTSVISVSIASGAAETHGRPSINRVAEEDLRERLADDGADAPARDRLRRVLPGGSAPEVRVDDEDRRAPRAPADRSGAAAALGLRAIVLEQVILETFERDRPEKPRRNDAIGVDVVAGQRQPPRPRTSRDPLSVGHSRQLPDVDDLAGHGGRRDHRRAHQQRAAGRAALPSLEIAVRRRGADSRGPRAGPGSSPGTSSSRRRAIRSRPR